MTCETPRASESGAFWRSRAGQAGTGDIEEQTMSATTLNGAKSESTGGGADPANNHIADLRQRIDEIDAAIIALWKERAAISQEVGKTRVASGGTRLVLSREREILDRFRTALGADGTQLGLLILRAGRGPL
jgi:chorismate mutase